jgi:hypothetical protein
MTDTSDKDGFRNINAPLAKKEIVGQVCILLKNILHILEKIPFILVDLSFSFATCFMSPVILNLSTVPFV